MTVRERLTALRGRMKAQGIDFVLISSSDFHASEYVGEYFKVTEFFSGCTSDNVMLLIGEEEARLWTDGRYFISAARELQGSGIALMKMGEKGVPTLRAYLAEAAKEAVLAFDGRTIDATAGELYVSLVREVISDFDPAEGIWTDRPALPEHPVFLIPDDLAGASFSEKLARVRAAMKEEGAASHLISRLDDIAWLLNMRGNDIFCNPVALACCLIGPEAVDLFMMPGSVTEELRAYAAENEITLHAYADFYAFLEQAEIVFPVLVEDAMVSYRVMHDLTARGGVVHGVNPTELMKAVKNPVEIENSKKTYLMDSVALCRFLCWFDTHMGKEEITELSAAQTLDAMRAALPGYIELSFPTISAYGPNAAMAHYSVSEESNAVVKPEGFLLVDSGGQYMGGTTDVTRTMAAGPLTDEMKRDFTLVAIANLNLLNARFLKGTTGKLLDAYARAPLWEYAINYNHGTGHGIGYILNVHEGPQNIRWKFNPGQKEVPFEAGMIISDEPGVYIEDGYGIRTETILLTVEDVTNEYGSWLRFEPLTWAPIDTRAVDLAYMQPSDVERLNAYHRAVREKIAPYLEGEELAWLIRATESIHK